MDEEEKKIVTALLASLNKAYQENGKNTDIDVFIENALKKANPTPQSSEVVASTLALSKEPLDYLLKQGLISIQESKTIRQFDLLVSTPSGLLISSKKMISPKLAIVIALGLAILIVSLSIQVITMDRVEPWFWPLLFSIGHLIGIAIRKTFDASVRVYGLLRKLKANTWIKYALVNE